MSDFREAIKDAIEKEVRESGNWNGISVEDGRYEGTVRSIDLDEDSIEIEEIDLDDGTMTVTAIGNASVTYKNADGEELSAEIDDVKVSVTITIKIGKASSVEMSN